jgi:predicted cupin superfamily sugar epimerase
MGGLGAADIIRLLGLEPHPEGGHYRETFRDTWQAADGRAASTAIYFLLKRGEVSRWHRIDAAEVWHWYAGAPLELSTAAVGARSQRQVLGTDLAAGARPQIVVPAGLWQQARSQGDFTFAGCTVAPGFSFARFELAPPGFDPAR